MEMPGGQGIGFGLAAIALAPLLMGQAIYVKCKTPRLPEAQGKRSGMTGSGPPLNLLILGDSAAAGVGVTTQKLALSGRLASILSERYRVSWRLIAQTGHKAKDTLAQLTKRTPERFDVAVTSLGVNDVTHQTRMSSWVIHQRRIIETLLSKFSLAHILLSAIPPLHLFPALPEPLRWYFGTRAARFNTALQELAKDYAACEFVPIRFPHQTSLMAEDGFHPGELAYRLWAQQIASVIHRRRDPSSI